MFVRDTTAPYRRIAATTVLSALLICVAVLATACAKEEVEVTSPWPKADRERSIEKPAPPPEWPLTGLPAPDSETPANVRILAIKVENSPAARPQSGLQMADIVYESITEGGITRFNCLFHSQVPETVGPVRSARLSDLKVVPQYDALFAFSGASGSVNAAVRAAGLQNLSQDAGVSNGYTRSRARRMPHNLYADITKLREEAVRRGYPTTQQLRPLAFDRAAVGDAPVISKITIPFSTANRVEWTYDPEARRYLRANNGSVHTDTVTGEQLWATNVVVMWARMSAAAKRDVTGSQTYDIELVGTNRVSVFHNGQRFDGTWSAAADSPPAFKAEDGSVIRLSPGNTWIQVVPTDVNITLQ